jgi:Uma2 family endonuclease
MSTIEDLEALPDNVRAELINGEIVMMSAVMTHSLVCATLTREIGSYAKTRSNRGDEDGWIIVNEAWVNYDRHNSFVHDLAGFYRRDILNRPKKGAMIAKPFWACEVMSPSNWRDDIQRKRVILEQHQVPYYWVIDPDKKAIQVFELKHSGEHYQILYAAGVGEGRVKLPPFADFELDLSELFDI